MANPPFNVDGVDKEKDAIKLRADPQQKDCRFPFGLRKTTDNANYLWMSLFWSALNDQGPRGFRPWPIPRPDARGSEAEIRQKLIESGTVDVIVSDRAELLLTR